MLRASVESTCLLCRLTVSPRGGPTSQAQPWLARRYLSTQRQRRPAPSRMVLSDTVARPPRSRDDARAKRRDRPDGPFASINRRVANVDPTRRIAQARSRDKDDKNDKNDKRAAPDRRGERGFKALKMHRSLASVSYGQRTAVKERIKEIESFDQFNLLPSIKQAVSADALKGMIDIKPTPIQRLAIPALLGQSIGSRKVKSKSSNGRQEFLLAAETGSGKTLAYLLPSIHAMKVAEEHDPELAAYRERLDTERDLSKDPKIAENARQEPHPYTARPRVVVLVPTAELVDQIGNVSRSLSHMAKFKTSKLSANYSAKVIDRNINSPNGVDVVISTPHLLASIAESDPYVLSRVTHLVIDEADSLLDRSFSPVTVKILDKALPSVKQLILCSATIPRRLDNYLATQFPNMQRITTPNLHAIPRRVQLGVIDASKDPYRNNKDLACADAIWTIGKDAAKHESTGKDEVEVRRIMVFVNEREKTQELADYLITKGIDAVALHRDTSEQRQSEMLAAFTSAEPMTIPSDSINPGKSRRWLPNTKVIVATDLASRGIDTLAVRHVVLYDVPHTTIDFIHRLGRAGRMGRRGRGIVLVGKDDRRDIVAAVKESMFMGQALV